MSVFYDCKLCQKHRIYSNKFGMHLSSAHGISCEEYYLNHILSSGAPRCAYVDCNNFTKFINLSNGHAKFCSHSCTAKQEQVNNPNKSSKAGKESQRLHPNTRIKMQEGFRKYLIANPGHQSKAGKLGGKKGGINCHKMHPEMAKQNGINSMLKLQRKNFFSTKKGVHIIYRSEPEHKFYRYLEFSLSVLDYTYEPFVINYTRPCGKSSYYIPDVLVRYESGIKHLIELKSSEPDSEIDRLKFAAARKYCSANGIDKFEVLFDYKLIKYLFKYSSELNSQFVQKLTLLINEDNFGCLI